LSKRGLLRSTARIDEGRQTVRGFIVSAQPTLVPTPDEVIEQTEIAGRRIC
jgi:hypothetical protein